MTGNGTHDAVVKLELSEALADPRDRPGYSAPPPTPRSIFLFQRNTFKI